MSPPSSTQSELDPELAFFRLGAVVLLREIKRELEKIVLESTDR